MIEKAKRAAIASAVLCVFTTGGAYAAQSTAGSSPASQSQSRGAIDIVTWDHSVMRQGYSAERLMDMDVKGSQGENIGDVKDMLVNDRGQVTALIVSHGGVLGIGDKELRVPFNEVKPDAKLENLVVPIAKNNAEKYRIGDDKRQARAGEMKLSELLDDQVALRGGARYGDVDDMIIGRDGKVKAIVVSDVERDGRFALPWLSNVYDRAAQRFNYDYDRNQIARLKPFDYSALGILEPNQRSAARQPGTATGGTTGRGTEGASGSDSRR